jgi:hypothetical protein
MSEDEVQQHPEGTQHQKIESTINLDVRLMKTFRERSPEARRAALGLTVERIVSDKTDTLQIYERISETYYREQELEEVLTKLRSGQKSVILEGDVAAGKTSFLIEMENRLFGIPHSYMFGDEISTPEKLQAYVASLESYSSQTTEPVVVIIENGCDIAKAYWEDGSIGLNSLRKKVFAGQALTPREKRAQAYYEQTTKLLTLLQRSQFRTIVGNYIGFFEPTQGLADGGLEPIWSGTFQRGSSEYFLEPKPADPEKCLTMLKDHIEFYAFDNHRPPENFPRFLKEEDEPYLRAIAKSKFFAFKELKRISPNRYAAIKKDLRASSDSFWEGILRRVAAQMDKDSEYLR